jgi:hypothetical protein
MIALVDANVWLPVLVEMVTFDSGFKSYPLPELRLLKAE